MLFQRYTHLVDDALANLTPSRETCRWIMEGEDVQLLALLQAAYVPRVQHFGKLVKVHILNNVQNGRCQEDCGYCSQSKDSDAPIQAYPMKTDEQIFAEAERPPRTVHHDIAWCSRVAARRWNAPKNSPDSSKVSKTSIPWKFA